MVRQLERGWRGDLSRFPRPPASISPLHYAHDRNRAALEAVANARHELARGDYEAAEDWVAEAGRVLYALLNVVPD